MKLTKRTLRKLIKEELKTSRLKEDNGEEIEDIGGGELSPGDLSILQQLQLRLIALAKGIDRRGEDVELKDFAAQLTALIQKLERLILGEPGEKIDRTRMSTGTARRTNIDIAKGKLPQ